MSVLSSYDRYKFYHTLPVFKSPLLRPGISISSYGRRAPIKETKWISTRDAAGGVIRGTPLQHTKKGGRGNPKGEKEKEMLLPPLDPTRIPVFYAGCAPESRWVIKSREELAVVTYLKVIKCRQYIWTTWTSRLFLNRVYLPPRRRINNEKAERVDAALNADITTFTIRARFNSRFQEHLFALYRFVKRLRKYFIL